MREILCSTGALLGRYNNCDYSLLRQYAGMLGCDGFEFMMYSRWENDVDRLVSVLGSMNVRFPVVHAIKQIGEIISRGEKGDLKKAVYYFEMCCRIAGRIGADRLVLHLWGGEPSDRRFDNNIRMYRELKAVSDDYPVELLIENVVCNVKDPMSRMFELMEVYPDMKFVFDTKMAAFHEQLELIYGEDVNWLWKDGHIRHLHVNDYNGGYMEWGRLATLPIGAGNIDFDTFFAFVGNTGYEGDFTVEATAVRKDGTIDDEMLNDSFDKIREAV